MTAAPQLRPVVLADRYEEEPARPLEAIAADLGELMAETAFAGLDRFERDYRVFCVRFGIGRISE